MRDPDLHGETSATMDRRARSQPDREDRLHDAQIPNGVNEQMADLHNAPVVTRDSQLYVAQDDYFNRIPVSSNRMDINIQSDRADQARIIPEEASSLALQQRPAAPTRARSDFGPRNKSRPDAVSESDRAQIRHGWDNEYISNEYLSLL